MPRCRKIVDISVLEPLLAILKLTSGSSKACQYVLEVHRLPIFQNSHPKQQSPFSCPQGKECEESTVVKTRNQYSILLVQC